MLMIKEFQKMLYCFSVVYDELKKEENKKTLFVRRIK